MSQTEQRRRSTLELHMFQRRADSQRMSRERRRLTYALLLSLLIHTLLLSLTFGGQGLWGFGFPWQDRRIEVPDLRVVLVPAQVTAAEPAVTPVAEPLQQGWVEPLNWPSAILPSGRGSGRRSSWRRRGRTPPVRKQRGPRTRSWRPNAKVPHGRRQTCKRRCDKWRHGRRPRY